jgi:glycerophosphoryl diester phosphodiesterase
MKIIGHRGLAEDYPENTVYAVKESSKTCDIVEIDIRQTADDELVVFHNSKFKYSKDKSYEISKFTLAEIRTQINVNCSGA